MPSILDRLIDPESRGTEWRRGYGLEQMLEAVRRDLEDLLNTRQTDMGLPTELVRIHQSIVGYGLPDLTSLNAITPNQREDIGRIIETTVARFEPRLLDVRARLVDTPDNKDQSIRFHIEARLGVDPAPEVAFDTVLELTSGQHSVKPSNA
jgi:type VI secretion system protein ImpF